MGRYRYADLFLIRAVPETGHADPADVLDRPMGGSSRRPPTEVDATAEMQRAPGVDGTPMAAPRIEQPDPDESTDTDR